MHAINIRHPRLSRLRDRRAAPAVLGLLLLCSAAAHATQLRAGNLLIAQGASQAPFLRLDVTTGNVTPIGYVNPHGLALDTDGKFIVTERLSGGGVYSINPATTDPSAIWFAPFSSVPHQVAVDPNTGSIYVTHADRVLLIDRVSGGASVIASGGVLTALEGIAIYNGKLYVIDRDANAVFRIDPLVGQPQIVSSGGNLSDCFGIAITNGGEMYISCPSAVVRVLIASGVQQIVSSGGVLSALRGIAIDSPGFVIVGAANRVVRIDTSSGEQVQSWSGGYLYEPVGIAIAPGGRLFVADAISDALLEVDRVNGSQALVTSATPIYCYGYLSGEVAITLGDEIAGLCDEYGDEHVFYIDPKTGSLRSSPLGGFFAAPRALAMVSGSNTAYATDTEGKLFTLDLGSGSYSLFSSGNLLAFPTEVAAGVDGFVYVLDSERVLRVDPMTGAQMLIASGSFTDIAIDLDGRLLLAAYDRIERMDQTTGETETVTSNGYLREIRAFTVDQHGVIWVAYDFPPDSDSGIVRVDRATGQQTRVAHNGWLWNLAGIAMVPEPGASLSGVSAMLVLTMVARSRRAHGLGRGHTGRGCRPTSQWS